MTRSESSDNDELPPAEAEARFNSTLRKLVNTPHKPHKPKPESSPAKAKGAPR